MPAPAGAITTLAAMGSVDSAADLMEIVDVSDTSGAPTGTNKKITPSALVGSVTPTISTNQRVLGLDSGAPLPAAELTVSTLLNWIATTRGSIVYRNATVWASLAPGTTAGMALLTGGAGADPSWGFGKFSRPLFDHFTDQGNGTTVETDLYSDTTAAGQLAANGDKIQTEYGGTFVSSATATRQVRLYFAGTVVLDTGALATATAESWSVQGTLIRVSATVVRYRFTFSATTAAGAGLLSQVAVGELTGLTLTGTNVLKVTGQAAGVGAATNDVVAKMGGVSYTPAA